MVRASSALLAGLLHYSKQASPGSKMSIFSDYIFYEPSTISQADNLRYFHLAMRWSSDAVCISSLRSNATQFFSGLAGGVKHTTTPSLIRFASGAVLCMRVPELHFRFGEAKLYMAGSLSHSKLQQPL
jgi:hypothetical protein